MDILNKHIKILHILILFLSYNYIQAQIIPKNNLKNSEICNIDLTFFNNPNDYSKKYYDTPFSHYLTQNFIGKLIFDIKNGMDLSEDSKNIENVYIRDS